MKPLLERYRCIRKSERKVKDEVQIAIGNMVGEDSRWMNLPKLSLRSETSYLAGNGRCLKREMKRFTTLPYLQN